MADTVSPGAPEPATPPPRSTLQLLILYPTLLLALGGSIPTVLRELHAWRLGIRSSQLELAQEQARLWERNLACLTERGVWESDAPKGITIAVSLCATGDMLVRYKVQGQETTYTWVRLPPADKLKPYHGR